jgi:multimeric flavodoxin WrbA
MMKVTAVVGTSRKNGLVSTMCNRVLEGAKTNGHETEIINLYDYKIGQCIGCWRCNKLEKCFQEDDFDKIYKKLEDSDVIVLGSPCYWGNVSGITKNFFDRHIPYMFQPSDIQAIKGMSFKQKLTYLMNSMKKLGPKGENAGKKFVLIVAATLPFPKSHTSGDVPRTVSAMETYVKKLKGKTIGKVVYTDTLFKFLKNKGEKKMNKAFSLGKKL